MPVCVPGSSGVTSETVPISLATGQAAPPASIAAVGQASIWLPTAGLIDMPSGSVVSIALIEEFAGSESMSSVRPVGTAVSASVPETVSVGSTAKSIGQPVVV